VRLTQVTAAVAIALSAVSSSADAAPREQHCVVEVTEQRADGELVLGAPRCYSTEAGARRAAGLPVDLSAAELERSGLLAASSTLGVHYDGANWSGSSITVSGSTCGGGYTNLTSAWRNRISSTVNGCFRVRHWDGLTMTGAYEDTVGAGGNLVGQNNRPDSIQYLAV